MGEIAVEDKLVRAEFFRGGVSRIPLPFCTFIRRGRSAQELQRAKLGELRGTLAQLDTESGEETRQRSWDGRRTFSQPSA